MDVCVSLRLESRFRGSVCFQLVFFSRARDYTIFTLHDLTDFYLERVDSAPRGIMSIEREGFEQSGIDAAFKRQK